MLEVRKLENEYIQNVNVFKNNGFVALSIQKRHMIDVFVNQVLCILIKKLYTPTK